MKTTNYNFNLIEKSDRILNTLDDLNENFNNIDNELYEIENKITETENGVNELNNESIKIAEKLDKVEAILDTSKASGENIYFDNAKNYPLMSLKGEGKSEQITTTGTQLIDFENLVNVVGTHDFKDNILAITNAEQARVEVYYDITQSYIKNAGQKIRFDFEKFESTVDVSNYSMQLVIKYSDGTSTKYSPLLSENWGTKYNLTISSDASNILSVQFYLSTRTALSANTLKITKPHLHVGESTIEYETYTGNQPAPNPNYPQEISTISEASYKGVGKNYFDIGSNEEYFRTTNNGSIISNLSLNFVDFTIKKNKIIINSYDTAGYPWLSKFVCLKKNTDYEVSHLINTGAFKVLGINSKDAGSVGVTLCELTKTLGSKAFNSGEYEYYFVSFYPNGAGTSFENIQIEKGTEATAYEPYQESTLPIDLKGNELASVGTVSDKLLIDRKGNVAIEKNVEKVVLDGSEDEGWIKNTNFVSLFYNDLKSFTGLDNMNIGINIQKFVSDTYIFGGNVNASTEINKIGIYGFIDGSTKTLFKRLNIKHSEEIDLSLEDFKICLSENPVTVYYELATPELIELDKIINPEIFKGVNNIVVETNIGNMNVEVEYVEDLQLRIEKIEQAIVSLANV